MNVRVPYIDRIWRVNSSLDLAEPLSARDAFDRLAPLFQSDGTTLTIDADTLTYSKKNPAAQDKLATFTGGVLQVEQVQAEGRQTTRLNYDLTSTALFLCFLAPLFFIAIAQVATLINYLERPALIAEMEQKKAEEEAEKAKAEAEGPVELHWIDQMLGAPPPKQPGEEDSEEGRKDSKDEEEPEGRHSPTTAYVLAGIFFAVFLVGRVLEPYLIKRTFRAHLNPRTDPQLSQENKEMQTGVSLAAQSGGNTET